MDAVNKTVELTGDAYFLLTCPIMTTTDGHVLRPENLCAQISRVTDAPLRTHEVTLSPITVGEMTFAPATAPLPRGFLANPEVTERVSRLAGARPEDVELSGYLDDDGFGAIAVDIFLPQGWQSAGDVVVGPLSASGRNVFAAALRDELLDALGRTYQGADGPLEWSIPYFNLTYGSAGDLEDAGCATLGERSRRLVYPSTPGPLASHSPWRTQFYYAGYAYSVNISSHVAEDMRRIKALLLVLDVHYARLADSASVCQALLQNVDGARDEGSPDAASLSVEELNRLAIALKIRHESLITPTFGFDHHILCLRDALLESWQVSALAQRSERLIAMLSDEVAKREAELRDKRIKKLNLVVTGLTLMSVISLIDSALSIYDFFTSK